MRSWFDRLCARINPPMPDAMQARMLRDVAEEYRLRRIFPVSYQAIIGHRGDTIDQFRNGLLTMEQVRERAIRGEL